MPLLVLELLTMSVVCFCSVLTKEYMEVLRRISPLVEQHKKTLVPGIPQLNMCDVAVMVRFTYYK